MKRIVYLGYYIKKLNFHQYWKFIKHTHDKTNSSFLGLFVDNLSSVFKYNISLLEYYQFGFVNKDSLERSLWAGTGFMYESINVLNPAKARGALKDKREFIKHYSEFIKHLSVSLDDLNEDSFEKLIKSAKSSGKILLKSSTGKCGRGIETMSTAGLTIEKLRARMRKGGNDMVEEFIIQHDAINKLSPSGLNTLRIITQINSEGNVDILGIRLRISVDSFIDNLAAGNIAAPVDKETGIVNGPGVYSDITKKEETIHPVSKMSIIGFQIPYFVEAKEMAIKAALFDKSNTSIGWDVAITNDGPGLIEGNHDWCKLLWQLPVKKGLKKELEVYTNSY